MNEHELMQSLEHRAGGVEPGAAPLAAMTGRAATIRKRRSLVTAVAAAAAVAVVATTISLVGLGDETSAPDVVSPDGGSFLDDALAVLPGDSLQLSFSAPSAAAARLGLDRSSQEAYDADLVDNLVADPETGVDDTGGLFTPLSVYVEGLADRPVNDYHVVWTAFGTSGPPAGIGTEASYQVYRMTPGTDLDALADELVAAGLDEDEVRGRRHVYAESVAEVASQAGLIADVYPLDFYDVTIDTEADLLITGRGSSEVLEVLDGERESLADTGTFDDVIGDLEQVELIDASAGAECYGEAGEVQEPEAAGYLVTGGDDGSVGLTARVVLSDEATAATDLDARVALFEQGPLGEAEAPLAEYGAYDVTLDGWVVELSLSEMSSQTVRDLTRLPYSIIGC